MKAAAMFATLSVICIDVWAGGSGGTVLSRGLANLDAVQVDWQDGNRTKAKFAQCLADKTDPASSVDCWAAATASDVVDLPDQARELVLDTEKFMGTAADCKALSDKESEDNPKCVALRLADIFNLSHPDRDTMLKERSQGSIGRILGLKLLLQKQQLRAMSKIQLQYGSLDAAPAAEKARLSKDIAAAGQPGNVAFQALIDASTHRDGASTK